MKSFSIPWVVNLPSLENLSLEENDLSGIKIENLLFNLSKAPSLTDLIVKSTRKVHPIVWVALGLATFQQLVGINVVFYYGAVLWQSVGFSEGDALMINVISGAVSIGAVAISIALVDKIGRKPLLFWGSVGTVITLTIMSIAFSNAFTNAEGQI